MISVKRNYRIFEMIIDTNMKQPENSMGTRELFRGVQYMLH
jgi:hypothetical protein